MLLLATACVSSPPIIADKAPCSSLVPEDWRAGVEGAAAPASVALPPVGHPDALEAYADLAREWMKFGVGQTGQLQKANGRTADAIGIIERCEARDRAAIERARPKILGIIPR
ncbi:hypothetical protein [uncultured Sphingopyxis sp.]|uniref:hypothetical protein n=1 Tax=uncultured Sphingopyxis sp. TaxID=310581 RepID=UPI00259143AC|nr:hypothetical protein [uncultured Sphingopyxis sp.]